MVLLGTRLPTARLFNLTSSPNCGVFTPFLSKSISADIAMAPPTEADSGERSPLLRRASHDFEGANVEYTKESTKLPVTILVLLAGSLALILLGESFQEPAFGEIEEGIFCREYYTNITDSATDPRCKDERVQSDIAMLEAVEATIRFVVSLVTAIPYGMAAERVGRQRILSLSMLGMALRYPLELTVCTYFNSTSYVALLEDKALWLIR